MATYRYLIVGGGMAADAAVKGIRERDQDGSIGLVSAERDAPYSRPPLSKALWKGESPDSIWRKTADAGATLHLGRRITRIDPERHVALDDRGEEYRFDKLLLATGGRPRRLAFGGDDVLYFRTLDDFRKLRELARAGTKAVVVGGGFIGSELAAALAMNGVAVTMLFPEDGIGARPYGPELSASITQLFRDKGVEVLAGDVPVEVLREGGRKVVKTKAGRRLEADVVVAGLGLELEVELAKAAGLAVSDGIELDTRLRTSHPDVFAAGDVANVMSPVLGRRVRVEHEDNAVTMGAAAGRSMAGDEAPYAHVPFFYTDLFELGYEAVGVLDSRLERVADWVTPMKKGVVYYLDAGRVRGVLLLDTWGKVDEARALMARTEPVKPEELKGRIRG